VTKLLLMKVVFRGLIGGRALRGKRKKKTPSLVKGGKRKRGKRGRTHFKSTCENGNRREGLALVRGERRITFIMGKRIKKKGHYKSNFRELKFTSGLVINFWDLGGDGYRRGGAKKTRGGSAGGKRWTPFYIHTI